MAVQLFDFYDSAEDNNGHNKSSRVPHFITSNVEHDSVKLVLEHFKRKKIAGD